MEMLKNTFEEFYLTVAKKRIIAFGASDFLRLISINYRELKLRECVDYVADNDRKKQGGTITLDGLKKDIISPEKLLELNDNEFAVLISSDVYAYEIYEQLKELLKEKAAGVFILSLMIAEHVDDVTDRNQLLSYGSSKIPKIIHYFWFSGEKRTGMAADCIESWKKACPDYELREWNGNNYDVTVNDFAYEAYKQRKWAYVSDYARLDVVHRYGGIYLDLDVFLYKRLDIFLKHDFFIGFGPLRDIEGAVFGARPGCWILKEMLQIYSDRVFDINESMTLLNLQPMLLDRFFERKGFEINGKYQERHGAAIYPRDLFSAKNWFTGENETKQDAYGIHQCAGGWVDKNGKNTKLIKIEGNRKLREICQMKNQD